LTRDVKIRLEPLRQQDREGGFLSLKKDLREGILAYHRVPARIVSQLIPGQLGGDNRSDMDMFYYQFNDLSNRSAHYWQGLAEHTALRIREFGRLQGYKKAKARYSSFRT